ncbi:MAG TPA: hypothetical protein VFE63_14195 [Roseiarcus sp.]|jgi:hypothetical protein|nr:hypothetical protein [Roseiarcus sp.]
MTVHTDGMLPAEGDVDRFAGMLGRPLKRYCDLAVETVRALARWVVAAAR